MAREWNNAEWLKETARRCLLVRFDGETVLVSALLAWVDREWDGDYERKVNYRRLVTHEFRSLLAILRDYANQPWSRDMDPPPGKVTAALNKWLDSRPPMA